MNTLEMKFATPVSAGPDVPLARALEVAREVGFDGVEVMVGTESHERLLQLARDAGTCVACVACDATYTGATDDTDERHAGTVRAALDVAAHVGATLVRLPDARVAGTVPISTLIVRFGDWLAPLADHAASVGVKLAVQNSVAFRHAADLWKLIDRLDRRSLGVCYDVLDAARAGETSAVGVSVLNSRIFNVRVVDAKLEPFAPVPLGTGDVRVENLIKRLRGIGFCGWVTLVSPTGEEARASLELLHTWRTRRSVSERELPFQKKTVAKK